MIVDTIIHKTSESADNIAYMAAQRFKVHGIICNFAQI